MPIHNYLDISIRHVPSSDWSLLDAYAQLVDRSIRDPGPERLHPVLDGRVRGTTSGHDSPLVIYTHNFGWWISTLSEDELDAAIDDIRLCGFSDRLIDILLFAIRHDCQWINIDRDGDLDDGLKVADE